MQNRFYAYMFWGFWVAIAFFTIYPTANWITAQRSEFFDFYFSAELNIPFIPEFIWFYLSMYLLFLCPPFFLSVGGLQRLGKQLTVGTVIAGGVFLLFPAKLGFIRVIPDSPIYQQVFATIYSLDHPHNLVPSLHVVFSGCIAMAITTKTSRIMQWLFIIWLVAIVASTVLVHQHHLVDVLTGLLLAMSVRRLYREE